MNQLDYDVVVLGGSYAGIQTALSAAKNGLKTAIIEENQIGGRRYLDSEKPLENLIKNNRILQECFDSRKNGLIFSDVVFDPNIFFDEVEKESKDLSQDFIKELKENGVDIFIGHGMVRPNQALAVLRDETPTRMLNWKNLIFAQEPVASVPNIVREKASNYLTEADYGTLDHFPNGLLIYGSGEPAVIAANIWASLGSQVYIVCPKKRLVPKIPENVEKSIIENLKDKRVRVYLDYSIRDIYQDSGYDYHIDIIDNDNKQSHNLLASELMVLDRMGTSLNGIEILNVQQEDGWIKTDDRLRTNIENIYTWTGSQLNANKSSKKEDKIVADYLIDVLTGKAKAPLKLPEEPYFLDFSPIYATLGEINDDTKLKGTYRNNDEFLNLFINPEYGEIVGVEVFHPDAHELVNLIEFLIKTEISAQDLVETEFSDQNTYKIIQEAVKNAYKSK